MVQCASEQSQRPSIPPDSVVELGWDVVGRILQCGVAFQEKSKGAFFEEVVAGFAVKGFSSPLSLMVRPREVYLPVLVNVAHALGSSVIPIPDVFAYDI
jgi:hypothetical protein